MSESVQFGRYQVERSIGSGGLGRVYLATDTQLDRRVALKVLAAGVVAADRVLERFQREAECAARVSHPGVVRVYDFGLVGETPYIAMEYVEGETLQERLKSAGKFRPAAAIDLIRELLEAVAACHEVGLIHRDIKPANLILDSTGRVRLLDLGLAKAADLTVLTVTGQILGTPRYLAPEMLASPDVDARADLYQVGLVLHECLEGRPAFDALNVRDLLVQIGRTGPPPLTVALPQSLAWARDFLARMTARTPEERFASAREALAHIAAHAAARSRPKSIPLPASPAPRLQAPALPRWRAPLAALALLALALVLGVATRRSPTTSPVPVPVLASTPRPPPASPSARPLRAVRELARSFVRVFQKLDLLTVFDRLRAEYREGGTDAASREQLAARWIARLRGMLENDVLRGALDDLKEALPRVATDPQLTPDERSALLRQVVFLADLKALVQQAFVRNWPLPNVDAEMPGVRVERTLPAGLTRLLSVTVPPPTGFNTVELDLATVTGGVGPIRWDFVVPPPLEIPRPLKRAYLSYRVRGASSTSKLVVRLAPGISGRLGGEVAVIRGGRDGAVEEGCVRIDERRLDDRGTALTLHFEYYSVVWLSENMVLERLELHGEPAGSK